MEISEGIRPLGSLKEYKYVITLSRMNGHLLMSRHRARTTWQNQGGHIEPGETPMEAARRELYEESGALEYKIAPLCDYRFFHGNAMVFVVKVLKLGKLPQSEMAEVRTFSKMPENLTYPDAGPELNQYALSVNAYDNL